MLTTNDRLARRGRRHDPVERHPQQRVGRALRRRAGKVRHAGVRTVDLLGRGPVDLELDVVVDLEDPLQLCALHHTELALQRVPGSAALHRAEATFVGSAVRREEPSGSA